MGVGSTAVLFAKTALAISQRRALASRFANLVDVVERAGLYPATAERALLGDLTQRFDTIAQILNDIHARGDARGRFGQLEEVLNAVEWDLAQEAVDDLTQKLATQEKLTAELRVHVSNWTELLKRHQPTVQRMIARGALPLADQAQYAQLEERVGQVERPLEGGRLAEALGAARHLDQLPQDLQALIDRATAAEDLTRTADLLLLRAPVVHGHEYTVLLRTPSRPGAHRFHIQDSTASVAQDRDWMDEQLALVANVMKGGLGVRYVKPGALAGTPAPAPTPVPAAPAAAPPVAAAGIGAVNLPADMEAAALAAAGAAAVPNAPATPPDTGPTRQLTADTSDSTAPPLDLNAVLSDVGDLMYRLVLPEYVQDYLKDQQFKFSFTITTNDLELPWELMCYDDTVLCLERPVGRMPLGRARPRRPAPEGVGTRKTRFLLVYCDPDGRLVQAKREIDQIRQALESRYKDRIDLHVWPDPQQTSSITAGRRLNDVLRRAEYDVIHFAGHATFNSQDADLSALIMDDSVPFYAQKIRRLLKGQPLVFLNACESAAVANESDGARTSAQLQRPVEGLAAAFVYGGALGCIGSLWPVHDVPAAEFSIDFYTRVLEGEMIGEALRLSRLKLKNDPRFPRDITWASFVLYGDPTFRLVS